MRTLLVLLLLGLVFTSHGFDINDPETNLDFFIRTSGSKDPTESTVVYFNGSVYNLEVWPGSNLAQIMYFEGYNINRKLWEESYKQYISLSLEFVVYRDPVTMEILHVYLNPMTSLPNEVFYVANNPVNGHFLLGDIIPAQVLPKDILNFNLDVVLEFPNVLDPSQYKNYSAGKTYDAVELFGYFSNGTTLSTVKNVSVGFTGTWIRKSQYLPWMEMGQRPGCLYFTTLAWTCADGIKCIADDILEIVKRDYKEFLDAPFWYEWPNESSWSRFKETIDGRRKKGLPDIIIPQVPIPRNVTTHAPKIDERVMDILKNKGTFVLSFNGTAYTEIVGQDSIKLFQFVGGLFCHVSVTSSNDLLIGYEAGGSIFNPATNSTQYSWKNPLTNETLRVPDRNFKGNFTIQSGLVYTIDIPERESLGLIAAHASSNSAERDWSVYIADLIFPYVEIQKGSDNCNIYGTVGIFSSWLPWMKMGSLPGNMVIKGTVYSTPPPP